jgi:hypothetical protein
MQVVNRNNKLCKDASHPDPDQSDKLDPDPHPRDSWIRINFQMTSQNVVRNMSLFARFFKVLSLYLDAWIWIWIGIRLRIKLEGTVGSGSASK